jgi:hypothetical protein
MKLTIGKELKNVFAKVVRKGKEKNTPFIQGVEKYQPMINLSHLVAVNKSIPLLYGNGISIIGNEGKGRENIELILKENNFEGLLKSCEYNLSTRELGNQV